MPFIAYREAGGAEQPPRTPHKQVGWWLVGPPPQCPPCGVAPILCAYELDMRKLMGCFVVLVSLLNVE